MRRSRRRRGKSVGLGLGKRLLHGGRGGGDGGGFLLRCSLCASLSLHDEVAPGAFLGVFAYDFAERVHPALFLFFAVGVEVDHFSVLEPDAEAFFDHHVAFFLFGESALPSRL